MTLECCNQRPLTILDACRDYIARRAVLDRLRERRGMSPARHDREMAELNASLKDAMRSLSRPTLEDEVDALDQGGA